MNVKDLLKSEPFRSYPNEDLKKKFSLWRLMEHCLLESCILYNLYHNILMLLVYNILFVLFDKTWIIWRNNSGT